MIVSKEQLAELGGTSLPTATVPEGILIYSKELSPETVTKALKTPEGKAQLLGYRKPKPQGEGVVVQVADKAGTPVKDIGTAPAEVPATVAHAQSNIATKPGDTVTVKPTEQVLGERQQTHLMSVADRVRRAEIAYRDYLETLRHRTPEYSANFLGRNSDPIARKVYADYKVLLDSGLSPRDARLKLRENLKSIGVRTEEMLNKRWEELNSVPLKDLSKEPKKPLPPEWQERKDNLAHLGNAPKEPTSGNLYSTPINVFAAKTAKAVNTVFDKVWNLAGLKGTYQRVTDTFGELGQRMTMAAQQVKQGGAQLFNQTKGIYQEGLDGLNATELANVEKALYADRDHGFNPYKLSPKEQVAFDKIHEGLDYLRQTQLAYGGPGINDNGVYRAMQQDPHYVPMPIRHDIWGDLKPGSAKFEQRHMEWLDHAQAKGMSVDTAESVWKGLTEGNNTFGNAQPGTPAYQATRMAEGIGAPPQWRMGLRDALDYHALRATTDLAFYKHIQSDPKLARSYGLTDDGWGNPIPEDPTIPNLGKDDAVKAILDDLDRVRKSQTDGLQIMTSVVLANQLGVKATARDVATTLGVIASEGGQGNFKAVSKAMQQAFGQGAFEHGTLLRRDSANIDSQYITESLINTFAEGMRKYTGRTMVNNVLETFNTAVGHELGKQRLAELSSPNVHIQAKAAKAFDSMIGSSWRDLYAKDPDALASLYAYNFRERVSSSHRAADLPPWMLGSTDLGGKLGANLARAMTTLTRWSVGRTNNFRRNVMQPAEEGDFKPLIKSMFSGLLAAAGVNALNEYFTGLKPKEMTFKEWINSGLEDPFYTIMGKMQLTGGMGALSDALWAGAQIHKGEVPMGIGNPGLIALENLFRRGVQAGEAMQQGQNPGSVIADLGWQLLVDNNQNLRLITQHNKFEETGDPGKREEALWKRSRGIHQYSDRYGLNPFLPSSKVKAEPDLATAERKYTGALGEQYLATGKVPNIKSPIRPPEFYSYLSTLQSPESAQAMFEGDKARYQQNAQKKGLFMRAAQRAVAEQGIDRETLRKWGY